MGDVVYLAGERSRRRGSRAAAAVTARFVAALSDEELRSSLSGITGPPMRAELMEPDIRRTR
jgi:hypothetical protein